METEAREQFAARAKAHGRSLGAESQAAVDELTWQSIEDGYRRLAQQPGELTTYLAAAAADEYPEYNT
jgi:hypothetical protein